MCGTIGDLQAGHVVVATGVAFQLARRERVLEREVFRFGTATSVPFLSRVSRVGVPGQLSQGRPPRVESCNSRIRSFKQKQIDVSLTLRQLRREACMNGRAEHATVHT